MFRTSNEVHVRVHKTWQELGLNSMAEWEGLSEEERHQLLYKHLPQPDVDLVNNLAREIKKRKENEAA